METADWHIFQILTKRSPLMRDYLRCRYGTELAPTHIWCGVSVEDSMASARIQHLRDSPASMRFLSIEPLLGPMGDIDLDGISWVIVGGESGPNFRRMEESWVVEIRDICEENDIPFFFKQWGGRTPKAGGRLLQGIEHNAVPDYLQGENWQCTSYGTPNSSPPQLEDHSRGKLDVLRKYLRLYFDTLSSDPRRSEFKLDLIDGFAGGGTFLDGDTIVSGTPLINA